MKCDVSFRYFFEPHDMVPAWGGRRGLSTFFGGSIAIADLGVMEIW